MSLTIYLLSITAFVVLLTILLIFYYNYGGQEEESSDVLTAKDLEELINSGLLSKEVVKSTIDSKLTSEDVVIRLSDFNMDAYRQDLIKLSKSLWT